MLHRPVKQSTGRPRLRTAQIARFQGLILDYFSLHARPFPWRETHDPYAILVSEIMLQQTQTARVVAKYNEFLAALPTIEALSKVTVPQLLQLWSGLGYNRRALALRALAVEVVANHAGELPHSPALLEALPGIGPYTAHAVACFAFGHVGPFIETNIRSVYLHHFFPPSRYPAPVHDKQILPLIEATVDRDDPRRWYYALMDFGAALKAQHPLLNKRSAHYVRQSPFRGSRRELRGKVVKILAGGETSLHATKLAQYLKVPLRTLRPLLHQLKAEGFPLEVHE